MVKPRKGPPPSKRSRPAPDKVRRRGDPLGTAKLDEFSLNKDSINPFESARLKWKVRGPKGMTLRLNGSPVPVSGGIDVQPNETRTYRLIAMLDGVSRHLGSAVLALSSDRCVSSASTVMDEFLAGVLTQKIHESEDLYFRLIPTVASPFSGIKYVQSQPTVTIQEGLIRFRLLLAADVNNFPDPTVDVVGQFGLKVVPVESIMGEAFPEQRKIVADNLDVDVKVVFPWHAYLVPGAAFALPIAESMAEDKAKKKFTDGIEQFVDEVLNWPSPQAGLVKHAVWIYVGDDDLGTVEIEYCPAPQLEIDPGLG